MPQRWAFFASLKIGVSFVVSRSPHLYVKTSENTARDQITNALEKFRPEEIVHFVPQEKEKS